MKVVGNSYQVLDERSHLLQAEAERSVASEHGRWTSRTRTEAFDLLGSIRPHAAGEIDCSELAVPYEGDERARPQARDAEGVGR